MVVDEKIRPDGRKPDEIRPIWCKVHYVPRVHGSGFSRAGQTQVFTAATLGSTSDAQRLDGIMAIPNKRYMHFYNFPPYSAGETARCAGPAGAKSATARSRSARRCRCCRPKEDFPYTLRLMSEVLESNGSSSMASVCGSTSRSWMRASRSRTRRAASRWAHYQGKNTPSSPTSRASKMRWARWTSKSRAPKRVSPRSRWTSRSGHHDRDHARSDGGSQEVAPVHHR